MVHGQYIHRYVWANHHANHLIENHDNYLFSCSTATLLICIELFNVKFKRYSIKMGYYIASLVLCETTVCLSIMMVFNTLPQRRDYFPTVSMYVMWSFLVLLYSTVDSLNHIMLIYFTICGVSKLSIAIDFHHWSCFINIHSIHLTNFRPKRCNWNTRRCWELCWLFCASFYWIARYSFYSYPQRRSTRLESIHFSWY